MNHDYPRQRLQHYWHIRGDSLYHHHCWTTSSWRLPCTVIGFIAINGPARKGSGVVPQHSNPPNHKISTVVRGALSRSAIAYIALRSTPAFSGHVKRIEQSYEIRAAGICSAHDLIITTAEFHRPMVSWDILQTGVNYRMSVIDWIRRRPLFTPDL